MFLFGMLTAWEKEILIKILSDGCLSGSLCGFTQRPQRQLTGMSQVWRRPGPSGMHQEFEKGEMEVRHRKMKEVPLSGKMMLHRDRKQEAGVRRVTRQRTGRSE